MSFIAELKRRNVIRVSAAYVVGAWAVAQVADLAFSNFGAPDWAMRALLVLLLVGLPIAAVTAWALELGPDGLKVDDEGQTDPGYPDRVKRRLNITIAGLVLIGLGLFIASVFRVPTGSDTPTLELASADSELALPPPSAPINPSIAVLPFVDMSPQRDQRHLADGVPTELMTALHRVDRLRVVSRTSAFSFRDSGKSIREIADALDVDHIVEGSIQRSGDQVRIEAALVDVRNDERLWSESYTQPIGDAFALQAGITRKIAAALRVVVGDEANADIDQVFEATANPAAYEEFLIGTSLWAQRGEENIRAAIEHFQSALELEPNFARAEAALANAYVTLPSYARVETTEQWNALAKESSTAAAVHAQNAMALDPELVDAYAALADLARLDARWSDAERLYQRGLEIDAEDATLNLWYAEHLQDLGKIEQALEVNLTALQLDPLSPGANANVAGGYMLAGDCDNVEAPARKAAALGHDFGYFAPVLCAAAEQRWQDALVGLRKMEAADAMPPDSPFVPLLESYIDASTTEDRLAATEALTSFLDLWGPDPAAMTWLLAMDETDAVIDKLLADDMIWGSMPKSFWGPNAVSLRENPRFNEVLEASGLLAYFKSSGELPDDCVWAGETLDCVNGAD
ncbi:MAG: hypothetical protein AAF265_15300 [Pseudomonadota bacterium]